MRADQFLYVNGSNSGVDPVKGLVGGVVVPGRLFRVPFAFGAALFLPDDFLSRVVCLARRTSRGGELYDNRNQLLYVAANLAVSPFSWLQIGGGISFMAAHILGSLAIPRGLLPCSSPRAPTDLHTGDGSITMRGLHGALRADTGDGSIRDEALDGAVDAHTGDGSVNIAGRFDKLQLHTSDGSVDVEAKDGSHMAGDWSIQTGDGSVHLRVPGNLAADLDAHTGDGSIRIDLPSLTTRVKEEHMIQSKLNGGGPALLLRTGDGSITVSRL